MGGATRWPRTSEPHMTHHTVYLGDCLDVMRGLEPNSIDAIVTDPPYGLAFMGKVWDHAVPGPEFFAEMLRVAKPGAHLFAFGGTRLYHRMTCAIEDAGWEIRDCLMWLYGSGFPKSLAIDKAIDRAAGAATDLARTFAGYGTALKPAWEPIVLAMKPLDGTFAANAEKWGVAGLGIDAGRVGTEETIAAIRRNVSLGSGGSGVFGAANKPGTYQQKPGGRWPANLALDEEAAAMLDAEAPRSTTPSTVSRGPNRDTATPYRVNATGEIQRGIPCHGDSGGPSRFFYTGKASSEERTDDNTHPTVKPTDLMRWLVRLAKPPGGGVILDPFCGSGSTGVACVKEGASFVGIEREPEYHRIATARIQRAYGTGPETVTTPDGQKVTQLGLF